MAYLIYLERLADDLQTVLPIQPEEWKACVNALGEMRLTGNADNQEILLLDEENQEWQTLFWLDAAGNAHTKAVLLFADSGVSHAQYAKAMQLAQHLQAYISGDDGEHYYIPGWHHFFWNDADDLDAVSSEELLAYRRQYGSDVSDLRARLDALRARAVAEQPLKASPLLLRPQPKWWQKYGWLLWLGTCVALYLLSHFLRG